MRPIDADRLLWVLDKNYGHTGGAAVMRQLIDIQPTLTPPNEWVSVEDRLPEPEFAGQQRGFYLVALSNGTVKELMYEFRHYENMMFDVGWHETAYPVTHWMPLPAPPDKGNNVPIKAPNEPLTCRGCMYLPDCPSGIHCYGCARLYTDNYRRPPEGDADA